MEAKTVGIDLGTTHSLCALFTPDGPQLIPNTQGSFLTPSVVGLLPSGEAIVGAAASELRITNPEQCAWCFKRYMGSDHKIQLGERSLTAHELSAIVLKSLKEDAEKFLERSVHDAVVTVPAYFNDHQRQATKLAGEMAGLNVRRMINEPTAAALVYGFHDRAAEKNLCVIDLGGGTFDVTVMEVFEGTLEIRSTAGESMLGGEDFTDRMVAAILKQEGQQMEVAEMKQPRRVSRLRNECEVAKRNLASNEVVRVRVPDEKGHVGDDPKRFKIDHETFAEICKPLMKRLAGPIAKALRDAECESNEIDDVILVGGSTRMPLLRSFVKTLFEKNPLMERNPDEVVALGAAVQAALIEQDAAVDDMVMTDVCPFTLGVEVAKEFGGQLQGGYFQPVIHRNTTIPISREEVFSTVQHNQPQVELRVFQGDARKIDQNIELGMLAVKLPPGPQGAPVHVRFTYDLNGILEIEAYAPGSTEKFRTVLTNHVSGLSRGEIDQAVKRLSELKFYPRESVANQHLASFAERMLGEVSPVEREALDQAIDLYENAMAGSDKSQFEAAKQTLLVVMSGLGIEYDESGAGDSGA